MPPDKILAKKVHKARVRCIRFKQQTKATYGSRAHWPSFARDRYEELKADAKWLQERLVSFRASAGAAS